MIAAITQAAVIRKIFRHLKLAADPPPIAPARARQRSIGLPKPTPLCVASLATCAPRRCLSSR
jgi:hypothetical protein